MATQQQAKPPDPKVAEARRAYLAEQYGYTTAQIDVIRNAICITATDEELEFFLATCKRVNLDPFARQIWFVKRRQKRQDARGNDEWVDVGRPETGIDGYRTIAERSGEYEGQAATEWCGDDGKWLTVWLKKDPPAAAKSTIYRKGFREPLINVAVFEEYAPRAAKSGDLPAMWRKMPANQLAKCSEAGAFRRAFPRDLSGLVTDTEMEHVDRTAATSYSAPAKPAEQSKQLDERKPDAAATIVDAAPTTAREAAPVEAKTTKSEPATLERSLEVEAQIAEMIAELREADHIDGLSRVGLIITEAKKTPEAPRTILLMHEVWPVLQERYRALKAKGRK